MSFKERGITVGDLIIFIIVMLLAFFVFPKLKNNSQKSLSYSSINNYSNFQFRR